MTDHPAAVSEPRPGTHTAQCPCGWIGADHGDRGEAEEDARLHREGKQREWMLHDGPAGLRPEWERPFLGA